MAGLKSSPKVTEWFCYIHGWYWMVK